MTLAASFIPFLSKYKFGLLTLVSLFFLVLSFCWSGVGTQKNRQILHCGYFIDVINGTTKKEISVILDGNTISAIKDGFISSAGDSIIDLKMMT